jgi:hypothetical protein
MSVMTRRLFATLFAGAGAATLAKAQAPEGKLPEPRSEQDWEKNIWHQMTAGLDPKHKHQIDQILLNMTGRERPEEQPRLNELPRITKALVDVYENPKARPILESWMRRGRSSDDPMIDFRLTRQRRDEPLTIGGQREGSQAIRFPWRPGEAPVFMIDPKIIKGQDIIDALLTLGRRD